MEERQIRIQKLEELRRRGIDPYPHRYDRTHAINQVRQKFDEGLVDPATKEQVRVAGRLMSLRRFGRAIFADLSDFSATIQIHVSQDKLGEDKFSIFKDLIDRGDIVGVEGTLFRTKTGEPTVECSDFTLLAKTLLPLPEKWHGLKDPEMIRRQRYLHLIMDENARKLFLQRSKIISGVRRFLEERGFVEVKTPILQPIYGGAEARPFETYHNALDMKLYLRIAPELYLKRLVVGGFEKVYEVCDCFRNEGIDALHNPEFSMLELYWAYVDYQDIMKLTEELFFNATVEARGSPVIRTKGQVLQGSEPSLEEPATETIDIDMTPPFARHTLLEAIKEWTGEDVSFAKTSEEVEDIARRLGVPVLPGEGWGEIVTKIFEEKVEKNLIQPTFILDYPAESCPLTKRHRSNTAMAHRLAERFELFINGMEFANAFSELTDPIYQAEQFALQEERRRHGEMEAHPTDRDYVTALEYGLPPTGGLGVGIDRLVMLLTGAQNIKDVILFPLQRQK